MSINTTPAQTRSRNFVPWTIGSSPVATGPNPSSSSPWLLASELRDGTALKFLHSAKEAEFIPKAKPGADTVVIDLDETLVAFDKISIEEAKKAGYSIFTTKDGRQGVIRPGAIELLEKLKIGGYKVIICTRNLREYAEDVVKSTGLDKHIQGLVTRDELLSSPVNKDFESFPRHPANIGLVEKAGTVLKQMTLGAAEYAYYSVRGSKPRFSLRPQLLNKDPHAIAKIAGLDSKGAVYLIDNKVDENKEYAKKSASPDIDPSQSWTVLDPGQFDAKKPEAKNSKGEYVWVNNILKDLNMDWKGHLKTKVLAVDKETQAKPPANDESYALAA